MESIVIMGVSGCGKSTVGAALADVLALPLIEGDDFHPPENVRKMRAGHPLQDADRVGWLQTLASELARHPDGAVLTCSALKLAYRDVLRHASPGLRFVYLELSREESQRRVAQRGKSHFFNAGLVDSQFEALETPSGETLVLTVDGTAPCESIVAEAATWVRPESA